ncbi:NUCLEAR RNA EXPORT FACTOR SDE5-RELATED [Salix viminalis]|uniref:NUCLEAR RNA EXPORT FACTOR SDE5-RELATED n=1 Tax=Salix viminalis TaxID=40686 RepID=A0A9Q0QJA3_SALVM|nr:NUCLEAR RNA EXPORT FACTOR SDE5-RELATED [Salix viminalis]
MEVSASNTLKCDDEEKALKGLLEAFGSKFSLEQIASAYCKAGRNADISVQILLDMEGNSSTFSSHSSNGEAMDNQKPSDSSNGYILKKCDSNEKVKTVKKKWHSVSGGTVSSVLGKSYITSMPAANGSCGATKPLKLDAQEFPMSELWGEEPKQTQSKHDRMHKDMEIFLFNMLGHGFQLERDVIQQVLDACGYDMQKSMEELLNLSGVVLDESNKYVGSSTGKFTDVQSNSGRPSCNFVLPSMSSHGGISNANRGESPRQGKERNNLQNEILTALFNDAERSEELSIRKTKAERRSIVYGELVAEPPTDFTLENKADSVYSQQDNDKVSSVKDDDDGKDSYQLLRDYERANKLMDEGLFFRDKAHEVDEESTQKIFESKNVETQDYMLLDLHEYGAKDAIRSLRSNLLLLSGIPSVTYLKVIIEADEEDVTKGARRRLIMKLLEKESIKWSEGGDVGTILIQLDNINPKRLSFAKK